MASDQINAWPEGARERLGVLQALFQSADFPKCLELADVMANAMQIHPLQTMIPAFCAELLGDTMRFAKALAGSTVFWRPRLTRPKECADSTAPLSAASCAPGIRRMIAPVSAIIWP